MRDIYTHREVWPPTPKYVPSAYDCLRGRRLASGAYKSVCSQKVIPNRLITTGTPLVTTVTWTRPPGPPRPLCPRCLHKQRRFRHHPANRSAMSAGFGGGAGGGRAGIIMQASEDRIFTVTAGAGGANAGVAHVTVGAGGSGGGSAEGMGYSCASSWPLGCGGGGGRGSEVTDRVTMPSHLP